MMNRREWIKKTSAAAVLAAVSPSLLHSDPDPEIWQTTGEMCYAWVLLIPEALDHSVVRKEAKYQLNNAIRKALHGRHCLEPEIRVDYNIERKGYVMTMTAAVIERVP